MRGRGTRFGHVDGHVRGIDCGNVRGIGAGNVRVLVLVPRMVRAVASAVGHRAAQRVEKSRGRRRSCPPAAVIRDQP